MAKTKWELAKAVGEAVVSVGVLSIVGNAVNLLIPANAGVIKKLCMGVGGVVLANIASDRAVEYVDDQFDKAINALKGIAATNL